MGDKYDLKKSIVKKRPKKRGKYRPKPHDPKKPKTNKEQEKIHPGYLELDRLARGVVEEEDDDDNVIGSLECDDCLVNGSFVPPANWGAMMSNDKTTQALFEQRLHKMRKRFVTEGKDPVADIERITNDMMLNLGGERYKIQSQVSDRLEKIQDNHPEFISLLSFLVEPLQDSRTKLGMKYPEFPKLFDDDAIEKLGDDADELDERKKSRANTPVSSMSPEQVQAMCRQRFGLMTMEDLLNLIDRIKRAEQGKKNIPTK